MSESTIQREIIRKPRRGMTEKALARTEKQCTRCGIIKPMNGFSKGGGLDGKQSWCRECNYVATMERRRSNPELTRERARISMRKTVARNRDKYREASDKRRRARIGRIVATGQSFCNRCRTEKPIDEFWKSMVSYCKECLRAKQKRYYSNNKDAFYAQYREWISNNKERRRIHLQAVSVNRRIQKAKAGRGSVSSRQWLAILADHDHRCFYCMASGRMEQEHKVPLSRGGAHSPDNVVPACGQCNRRKSTKTADEFFVVLP